MVGYNPPGTFPFAINSAQTVSSLLTIIYGHRISLKIRISSCMFLIAAILMSLPIATTELKDTSGYWTDISLLFVLGLFTGAAQASIFSIGGVMPNKYLSAIIVGNSYCAILINVIQGIFLLTFSDLFENTLIYYIIASVILIVTGLLNCKFQELEFVRYWLIKANNRSATGDNAPENAYNLRKDSVNTMDSNSN